MTFPLTPPMTTLHPSVALDAFLASLPPPTIEGTKNKSQDLRKLILQVADSLFGSLLEGALTILDSYTIHHVVADPSHRQIFVLVNNHPSQHKSSEETNQNHFCFLPQGTNNTNEFPFCSCRSYFERTKGTSSNCEPPSSTVCKHLLALKLRPYLLEDGLAIELVSDDEFGDAVADWLYGEAPERE